MTLFLLLLGSHHLCKGFVRMVLFEAFELFVSHKDRDIFLTDFTEIHLSTLKVVLELIWMADDLGLVLFKIPATANADFCPKLCGPYSFDFTMHFWIECISPDNKLIFDILFFGPNPCSCTSESVAAHVGKDAIDINNSGLVVVCLLYLTHYHGHVAAYSVETLR